MAHKSFPSVVSNGNLSDGQLVNSLDPSPESIENLSPLVENQPNLPTSNKIYEHSAILQMNKSSNKEIWGDNMPNESLNFVQVHEVKSAQLKPEILQMPCSHNEHMQDSPTEFWQLLNCILRIGMYVGLNNKTKVLRCV